MNDVSIRIRGLSKKYRIPAGGTPPRRHLGDSVSRAVSAALRRVGRLAGIDPAGLRDLWALKDLTLDIRRGEVIGIVGRNGAGKSTLLKILSSITRPTEGTIEIAGRVGSLLEVGTGFRPELTGHENIYLNGAILGMSVKEIEAKMKSIVEFSGVEEFLNLPVKRYSSGMYIRLAFAVASQLEPEIMIVDEVLAVGDWAFQRKCLERMREIAGSGRTVILVSHNTEAVARLCSRVIWLENGKLVAHGPADEVLGRYLEEQHGSAGAEKVWDEDHAPEFLGVRLRRVCVLPPEGGAPSGVVPFEEGFCVEVEYEVGAPTPPVGVILWFFDASGQRVFSTWDSDGVPSGVTARQPGTQVSRVKIPGLWLKPGDYHVSVRVADAHGRFGCEADRVVRFTVRASRPPYADGWHRRGGVVTPLLPWTVEAKR